MGIRKLLILQLLLTFSVFAVAQSGKIKGHVTDEKTNEPLVGATVMLEGTTTGTITDFDGNYAIGSIPSGTYTLRCSFISYETKLLKDVTIAAGQELEFNFKLGESTVEIGGVEVVAKANRESESMLLVEQKNAVLATQAIGAQEISRKGAGDAEAAVTKISGISKQEGVKNVFVRGLGDRFNSTTLNGFPVPSEDPEYKNISLGFFSSDIIKTVGVDKVFSAGTTGDVAGAEINISSKELSGNSDFSIGISSEANTETLNQHFLVTDGFNALGFAQNTKSPASESSFDFKNSLDPSAQDFQLGKEIAFAGGKRFELGTSKNPLSFYVIGNYSTDFSYLDGITRGTTTTGDIFLDQTSREYEKESSHLLMANLTYSFNKYRLSYNLLAIHTGRQSLRDDYGMDGEDFQSSAEYGYKGLIRRQQNNDNTLLVNQLHLERDFTNRLSADAGASFNYTNGKEPDRRINYLSYCGDDILKPLLGSGTQQRYFSKLEEKDFNARIGVTYKLTEEPENPSAIKAGYKGRLLKDNFHSNSWDNSRLDSQNLPELNLNNFSLDSIFNQTEFENGKFKNSEYNESTFSVDKSIHSFYGEFIYQIGQKLILDAGVKADKVNLTVDYDVNGGAKEGSTELDKFYILPGFNLKYNLNDKNALRFGVSRTYTLPQSKEISPYRYQGPKWNSQGNPGLQPSTNYNADLKWDFYMSRDELFSVTVFGKLIQDPISRIEKASAGGFLTYENIADNATIGGVEVEARKNIFSTPDEKNEGSTKLSTGVNFSYITTDVKVYQNKGLNFTNAKTELEGAAPVLVNADLSFQYRKKELDFTGSLVANYFSDRIYTIGAGGYQDIKENGLTTLDFISSVKIKKHWGVSLKAKNLLNPDFRLTREPNGEDAEPIVLSSYKKGINFSLGLSYQF